MNKRILGGLLAASLVWAQAPEDFGYGLELALPPDHSVYSLEIPEEVYRHLQSPLFDDLAIFNSQNQAVPYQLFEPRLYIKQPQSVYIRRLASRPQDPAAEDLATPGYLLSFDNQGGLLSFEWEDPKSAGTTVTLWMSNDLTTWSRKGDLELTDPELVGPTQTSEAFRSPLNLAMFPETYFWLEAPSGQLPKLAGAYLTYPGSSSELFWLKSEPAETVTDGIRFDLGGFFPVQQVRIGFVEPPGQVSGELFVEDSWTSIGIDINSFHLIEAGRDLISPPVSVGGRAPGWPEDYAPARAWRLQAEGARAENLFLEFGYVPHKLMFLAEGEGPYILAYGSGYARTRPAEIMAGLPVWATPAQVSGEPQVLGGARRLSSDSPSSTWLQAGVYLALLLAAVVLAWLAYRLLGSASE